MDRLDARPTRLLRYIGFAVGGLCMVIGVLAMVGMLLPGETFIPPIFWGGIVFFLGGLAYWQLFASSHVIVDQGVVSRRMFGLRLWSVPLEKAALSVGMDPTDKGAYMLSVIRVYYRQGGGLVGVIPYKQMHPDDVARLFRALGLPPKDA